MIISTMGSGWNTYVYRGTRYKISIVTWPLCGRDHPLTSAHAAQFLPSALTPPVYNTIRYAAFDYPKLSHPTEPNRDHNPDPSPTTADREGLTVYTVTLARKAARGKTPTAYVRGGMKEASSGKIVVLLPGAMMVLLCDSLVS